MKMQISEQYFEFPECFIEFFNSLFFSPSFFIQRMMEFLKINNLYHYISEGSMSREGIDQIQQRLQRTNLYHILDLPVSCSVADVKKSYKRLALIFHPDKNSDRASAEVFKQIAESYNILSNPETKERYDQTLKKMPTKPDLKGKERERDSNGSKPRQRKAQNKMQEKFMENWEAILRQMKQKKQKKKQSTNQQRQNRQKMKKQYEKELQKREKSKKENLQFKKNVNLSILVLFIFLVLVIAPKWAGKIKSKPIYLLEKSVEYNHQMKTILNFTYFIREKTFMTNFEQRRQALQLVVNKVEMQKLKVACRQSQREKKFLEVMAFKEKIGKQRNSLLQQAKAINQKECHILIKSKIEHPIYMKDLFR